MNRISLLGLLLLLASAASAWDPYSSTRRFFRKAFAHRNSSSSSIPQFILDTSHPWLTANEAWLSRYPNIGQELCSLDSSLWKSPFPTYAPPADLFTNLSVEADVVGGYCRPRISWSDAHDQVQEIAACKAALENVRNLHVELYVDADKDQILSSRLPELFSDVLGQMRNLERLDWDISSKATREFEPAFIEEGLMLPSVKRLRIGAGSDYLVSRCPNVEVLESDGISRSAHLLELIKASTGLENLKDWHLSIWRGGWTTDLVKAILDATPNITGLHMEGYLNRIDTSHETVLDETEGMDPYFRGPYAQTLKRYLHLFSQFSDLERLSLPASRGLDLGFDGGHWCGNAYDGPEGRAYGRSVTQEGAETDELAANITLGALPHLKSLSVGSEHGNLTINDVGQPEITWPWTGRMEQYTYEVWEDWD